jgi:hypothetical protein
MRFQVLTAMTVNNTIIWDVTPCILVNVYRHIGRLYSLHLQGRKESQDSLKLYFSYCLLILRQ